MVTYKSDMSNQRASPTGPRNETNQSNRQEQQVVVPVLITAHVVESQGHDADANNESGTGFGVIESILKLLTSIVNLGWVVLSEIHQNFRQLILTAIITSIIFAVLATEASVLFAAGVVGVLMIPVGILWLVFCVLLSLLLFISVGLLVAVKELCENFTWF